jgi:hypothetical protein
MMAMRATHSNSWQHVRLPRREAVQVGAIGLLGLGMNHLAGLRLAHASDGTVPHGKAKSCIFIFLSGGLAQHESFDPKPQAPDAVRGEFQPIATRTPGVQICEHLPMLAERSERWALCRSLTHPSNDHSAAHHIMLTGRSQLPTGFDPGSPKRTDFPSIASLVGYAIPRRNNLPPAAILPERLVHSSGRVIPGQKAGVGGSEFDEWLVEAAPIHNNAN